MRRPSLHWLSALLSVAMSREDYMLSAAARKHRGIQTFTVCPQRESDKVTNCLHSLNHQLNQRPQYVHHTELASVARQEGFNLPIISLQPELLFWLTTPRDS